MKLDEARAICRDFAPVRGPDGKVRCTSIQFDKLTCVLPTHFVCELVRHADKLAGKIRDIPLAGPKLQDPAWGEGAGAKDAVIDPPPRPVVTEATGYTPPAPVKHRIETDPRWSLFLAKIASEGLVEARHFIETLDTLDALELAEKVEATKKKPRAGVAAAITQQRMLVQIKNSVNDPDGPPVPVPPPPLPTIDPATATHIKLGSLVTGDLCMNIKGDKTIRVIGSGKDRAGKDGILLSVLQPDGTWIDLGKAYPPDHEILAMPTMGGQVPHVENVTTAPDAATQAAVDPVATPTSKVDVPVDTVTTKPAWDERWSYSKIETGGDCLRKFWFRYVASIPETNPYLAFTLGKAFDECRDQIMAGIRWEIPPGLPPVDAAKLQAVLELFAKQQPFDVDISQVKVEWTLPNGTPMVGYMDGLARDGKDIAEFKYTVDMDGMYTPGFTARQGACYLTGHPKAERFVMIGCKKPRQKLKEGEEIETFKTRVKAALEATPADVFEVHAIPRGEIPVDALMNELSDTVDIVRWAMTKAEKAGTMPPASRGIMKCPMCSYYGLCEMVDGGSIPEKTDDKLLAKAFVALHKVQPGRALIPEE
ncbi:MAG: hypothetical protein AABY46_08310 [Nitrospirota bacterium]